jgi:hypothetical protein
MSANQFFFLASGCHTIHDGCPDQGMGLSAEQKDVHDSHHI